MIKRSLKYLTGRLIRPIVQVYLKRERSYRYENITVHVLPGVFHPGLFFSTKFLLQYLAAVDLKGKSLLEAGAGTGLISFFAEKKGAVVTSTDLSNRAIENLKKNKSLLQSKNSIVKSDLFDDIAPQSFDFIVINPPYYPGNPSSESQLAWYCGSEFQYFEKLFSQLSGFLNPISKIILVLSEDCDIGRIGALAEKNNFRLYERARKKFWWEWNYIFEIVPVNALEKNGQSKFEK
jgi:release factor glutamine methyltransferase